MNDNDRYETVPKCRYCGDPVSVQETGGWGHTTLRPRTEQFRFWCGGDYSRRVEPGGLPANAYKIEVILFDSTDQAQAEALFDRVADAAHELDEQVSCSAGPVHITEDGEVIDL